MVESLRRGGKQQANRLALALLLLLTGHLGLGLLAAPPPMTFGPVDVVRQTGAPDAMRWTFPRATPGAGGHMLCVDNGGQHDQYFPVTSASIILNGVAIFQPKDFKQSVNLLSKSVIVRAANELKAELASKPGSGLTIWVVPGASCAVTVANRVPTITSTPVTTGTLLQPYLYPVTATDGDNDQLTYSLTSAPLGMTIDSSTGAINWLPPGTGTLGAVVKVDDGHGGTTTQTFSVSVGVSPNRPPQLVPIANRKIPLGATFKLEVAANDPDPGDTLTFALPSGPSGALMAPASVVTWTPGTAQLGFHNFVVDVHDAAGASHSSSFTLEVVNTNGAPVLDPQPDETTTTGVLFTRSIMAVDPNAGDTLSFARVSGPAGLTVSPSGALAWTPTPAQLGSHQVKVSVTDNTGLSDVGGFTISVDVPAAPQLLIAFDDRHPVRLGSTLNVPAAGVLSNDLNPAGGAMNSQLVTAPTKGTLSLSPNGGFSYTPTPAAVGSTLPQLAYAFSYTPPGGGVLSTTRTQPVVADLDRDGKAEIIFMAAGVFANRQLIAIHGDTGAIAFAVNAYQPLGNPRVMLSMGSAAGNSTLAVGDLDADGSPEILAVHSDNETNQLRRKIIAFNADGTYRWTSADIVDGVNITQSNGGFDRMLLADLDGNGTPEILVKHQGRGPLTPAGISSEDFVTVFNSSGQILWTSRITGTTSLMTLTVADIDIDGKPDVLIGGAVLDNQGQVKWNSKGTWPGFVDVAVANLDGDPFAEIVYRDRFGEIYCFEHGGTKKWGPVGRVDYFGIGLFTIGDTDGDGQSEIVLARDNPAGIIEVWDRNGNLMREMQLPGSLNTLGNGGNTTIFDLNGDGRPEVLYQGVRGSFDVGFEKGSLFIFDGPTGALLHELHATRGTSDDTGPIVADVDGDGSAEIITGGWDDLTSIRVFKAASGKWAQTRPIWNQLDYHATNVESTGGIPALESVNWLTPGLNNFRVNTPLPAERTGDSDSFTYIATSGALTSNVATVRLDLLPPNTAPRILSLPPAAAAPNLEYLYGVQAADPDPAETLTFSLTMGPSGMVIGAGTGVVRWTPGAGASGPVMVVVKVTDSQGQSDSQQFNVIVGPPTTVPDVAGHTVGSAQTLLGGAGLTVGTVTTAPSATVAGGLVISQDPVAGNPVASGGGVNLVVSSGPMAVTVPHLVGKPESAAQAQLAAAGFAVSVTRTFSNTVPDGVVMGQNPVAGTPLVPGSVTLTVSAGSGLALRLSRDLTTADASIPFIAVAYDLAHVESAAPALTYVVTPTTTPSFGSLPTVSGSALVPGSSTRGGFRVTATDSATGHSTSADFAVTFPRGPAGQPAMTDAYASLSGAMSDIDEFARQGKAAVAAANTPALRSLLDQMVQRWRQVDTVELRMATPFGLPQGFLPSPADLASLGLTPTADDLLAQHVFKDAITDLEAWIDGLRAPTTPMVTLNALADQFNTRAARLTSLTLSEWGVIKSQAAITIILSELLPELYEALTIELEQVVVNTAPDPAELLSGPAVYESLLAEQLAVTAMKYVIEKIADEVNVVKKIREEGFKQAAWVGAVVMAASHFKTSVQGQSLTAVVAGASLSFHIFGAPDSFVEADLDTDNPRNNVVITIGPDVLGRLSLPVGAAANSVKGLLGTAVKAGELYLALQQVYSWLKTGSSSPSVAKILHDSFQTRPDGYNSCLFSSSPTCGQLVYPNGFNTVYEVDPPPGFATAIGLPVPILFIVYNKTTGTIFVDTPVFLPTKK